ncbi:MAG: insulinase family protein [Blastocatellia bacterium]|nr:insulinase family protein [Blastocatellia bacterium]
MRNNFRVQGSGFRVQGLKNRLLGLKTITNGIILSLLLVFIGPVFGQGQQPPPPDAPKQASFPPVVTKKLKNGLRVFVVEDHSLPVVSVRLTVNAGAGTESTPAGLAAFTARMLKQGTKFRDAQAIANYIDSVGGSLYANADYDGVYIGSTVIRENIPVAFNLVSELASKAIFKPEEIERQKTQLIGEIQVNYANPTYVADVAFRKLVLGDSPFGQPLDGTADTIKGFTREQMVDFYQKHYLPNTSFLVIGGDITASNAEELAKMFFGDWKAGKATPAAKIPVAGAAKAPAVVVIDKPGAAQTAVRVGNIGITRRDPEYFPTLVMNSVLGGGYSARLNKEIRIKRGLSYGARSNLEIGSTVGLIRAGCSTKSASTAEALGVILDELKRIRAEAIPATELDTRKAAESGSFVQGLQTVGELVDLVSTTVQYGLDLRTLNDYTKSINGITVEQAKQAAQKKLAEKPLIVLVGDAKVFRDGIAKTYGEPTVIQLANFDPLKANLTK